MKKLIYRPIVNFGGRPKYGGVEITVSPNVIFEIENKYKIDNWLFDNLKIGFEKFIQENNIDPIKISVINIFWHPIDTTPEYMQLIGKNALAKILTD